MYVHLNKYINFVVSTSHETQTEGSEQHPADKRHWAIVVSMLDHRLRRWPDTKNIFYLLTYIQV